MRSDAGRALDVNQQYYMLDIIDRDRQAIYLGTVPQDDLVRKVDGYLVISERQLI
jgi:hypothetical protein